MSLEKHYSRRNGTCKLTFIWEDNFGEVDSIKILGDYNNWNKDCSPMRKVNKKVYKQTIELETHRKYQFRYLINDRYWEDVPEADHYIPNGLDRGDYNSEIIV